MKNLKDKICRPNRQIIKGFPLKEIQDHYDSMNNFGLEVILFNVVFNVDKTLFALISGALTGLSTNILTGFLDFSEMDPNEKILHSTQLIFALLFNIVFIWFTAKTSSIKDSGSDVILKYDLSFPNYKYCKHNTIYNNCRLNINLLKLLFILSIIFALLTIFSFFCGNQLISRIYEILIWLSSQLVKLKIW